jgi:ribokinase
MAGRLALDESARYGLPTSGILPLTGGTAQSVILYEASGRRQIHVDLKDIQETVYPTDRFIKALEGSRLAVLCNINFSRPMLAAACQAGIPVATDVHTISRLDDPYEVEFLEAATILFMSHERLPQSVELWIQRVFERYPCQILGIGMGDQGALLVERGRQPRLFKAVTPRPVVNTIGTGDALFASFLHYYLKLVDAAEAMRRAVVFAGYKAGSSGAADGFLNEQGVEDLL